MFSVKEQKIIEDSIEYTVHTSSAGNHQWFYQGKLHRLEGPAVIWSDGFQQWYVNGVEIIVSSQQEFEQKLKLKSFE